MDTLQVSLVGIEENEARMTRKRNVLYEDILQVTLNE